MSRLASNPRRPVPAVPLASPAPSLRVEDFLESVGEPVLVSDANGRLLAQNKNAERIFGSSFLTVTRGRWTEVAGVHDSSGTHKLAAEDFPLEKALQGQVTTNTELFIRNAQKPEGIWLRAKAHPLLDERGSLRGAVATFTDISEVKKREEALTVQQDRVQRIIDAAQDAFVTVDSEGRVLDWSQQAERSFGWAAIEIQGQLLVERLVPASYRSAYRETLQAILAGGMRNQMPGARLHMMALHKEGREIPVEVSVSPIVVGTRVVLGAFFRDISEQRRFERIRYTQYRVSQILAEERSLSTAGARLLREVCKSFEWDVGELWLRDPNFRIMRCLHFWRVPDPQLDDFEARTRNIITRPGYGLSGKAWEEGRGIWLSDLSLDPDFPRMEIATSAGLNSGLAFPLSVDGEVQGTLVFFSRQIRPRDYQFSGLLDEVSRQIGQFIKREQTEEALRVSEERYRLLAETCPQIVWTATPNGTVDYSNSRWFEYVGGGGTADSDASWLLTVHADDKERVLSLWRRSLSHGSPYESEYRLRRADGAYRWQLARALPVRDKENRIVKWVGTTTDIEDQKSNETAQRFLAEASTQLSTSLDSKETFKALPRLACPQFADVCAIHLLNDEGRLSCASVAGATEEKQALLERLVEKYPHTEESAYGPWHVLKSGSPEFMPNIPERRTFSGATNEEHGQLIEKLAIRSYMCIPIRVEEQIVGTVTFMFAESGRRYSSADLAMAQDLSGRMGLAMQNSRLYKTIEQALEREEESLEFLDRLLSSARVGFGLLDPELRHTHVNQFLSSIYGLTTEQVVGKKVSGVSSIFAPIVEPTLQQVLQTGAPAKNIAISDDASVPRELRRHWLASYYPVFNHGSQIVGVGTVVIEVTDRLRAEEELKRAKEEAEAANSAKSAFLANISHEIRTPLNAIIGFSDVLLDPAQDANEKLEYATTIKRNGELLSRLIDDLLDLSKIEAGRLDIERMDLSLLEILSDVRGMFALKAEANGLILNFSVEGRVPATISADPVRLRQALYNVVGNAVKFTKQGEVNLQVRFDAATQRIAFVVRDTGIGISPQQQSRLFHPFSQAEDSTSRKYGGTGLGLVLARRLARGMGGDLVLSESQPGHGSVFVLTIDPMPLKPNVEWISELATKRAECPSSGLLKFKGDLLKDLKILVVDDTPDNQFLASKMLTQLGAKVELAKDGREGVEKALSNPFDLVLMDIQMPEVNGFEALAQLKEHHFDHPVIALTARALSNERDRCLEAGFAEHVSKPIVRRELIDKVSALTGRQ